MHRAVAAEAETHAARDLDRSGMDPMVRVRQQERNHLADIRGEPTLECPCEWAVDRLKLAEADQSLDPAR